MPVHHDSRRTGQADRGPQSRLMRTLLHLKPGQKGTKQLLAQYGDRLVCGRYRYDAQRKKRFKTVELIAAQRDWDPPAGFSPTGFIRHARRTVDKSLFVSGLDCHVAV